MNWKSVVQRFAGQWYVKAGVSVVLLWLVFHSVNIRSVIQSIRGVPVTALLVNLLIMAVVSVLASWRWAWWLDRRAQRRVFPALLRATALSYLYNLFMPSSVGGDALKWTSAIHLGYSKRQLIVSVILDRLSGVIGLVFFGFVSVLWMHFWGNVHLPSAIMGWFTALFIATVLALIFNTTPWHLSRLPVLRRIAVLLEAEQFVKKAQRSITASVAISMVIHLISYYAMYVLSEGLHLGVSLWYYFALGSITSLLLTLPISFAGFGVTEVSFVYFFTQVGATKTGILALVALLNVFKFVLALLGWCYDVCCQVYDKRPRKTPPPNQSSNGNGAPTPRLTEGQNLV